MTIFSRPPSYEAPRHDGRSQARQYQPTRFDPLSDKPDQSRTRPAPLQSRGCTPDDSPVPHIQNSRCSFGYSQRKLSQQDDHEGQLMKSLGRIDGSFYGAIFSGRPSPASRCAALCATPSAADPGIGIKRLYHAGFRPARPDLGSAADSTLSRVRANSHSANHFHHDTAMSRSQGMSVATTAVRPLAPNFFTHHHPATTLSKRHQAPETLDQDEAGARQRQIRHPEPLPAPTIDELLNMVDRIDDDDVEDYLRFLNDPHRQRYAPPDGPNIVISDKAEDVNMQSYDPHAVQDPKELQALLDLADAVHMRIRKHHSISLDQIWALYHMLGEPRMSRIPASLRHALLAAHSKGPKKDAKCMLRYLALVADVKASGFALKSWEWNTAISFTSRYVATASVAEVEASMRVWEEMEKVSGVPATDVTFNILFDTAVKAGSWDLAEMLYQEMIRRQLRFSRYHHVTLIHFFSLKGDSGGVRAAYREMVKSGEIIDTVVLNCVLAGLLRCGEETSALGLYEKMKARHTLGDNIPDRNYELQKSITKVLMMFANIARTHPSMRPNFQKSALLAPDFHTYRVMINHFGVVVGDLSKVAQLLDEMKWFQVPLHGAIFLSLFKAFSIHGGDSSDWSEQRLESVWEAFLEALDTGAGDLYISTWIGMYVLRAFGRYSTREQMLDIYEALRSRWDLDVTNTKFMFDFFDRLVSGKSKHVMTGLGAYHTYVV
ncbi:pentatricopeptide repeat domain-containing protein 1 [Microdochium nivale]|nr:pentatricopeptide repeat domain-containing protein 1 [Microdochium nivale]